VNANGGLFNSRDHIYVGFDGAFPEAKNQVIIQDITVTPQFPTDPAGSTLDFLASAVTVHGLANDHTALEVDDEAAPAGQTYLLGVHVLPAYGFLTRPGAGAIIYDGPTLDFTLNAGNHGTTIAVQGVDLGTSATISGGKGDDTITVADALERLDNIGGPLTIDGGAGTNVLIIDDRGNGASQTYALSASQFLRQGNPAVLITFSHLSSLDFYASDDTAHNLHDTITVSGTPKNLPVTVHAGDSAADLAVSDLDHVQGPLAFHWTSGNKTLVVNDMSAGANADYTLKAGSVARNGAATVTFDPLTFLTLYLGLNHNNDLTVQATAAGTNVQVYAGNGTNGILIGDPSTKMVDAIQGPLAIHGGSGPATVTVDDRGTTPQQSYALTAAELFRPAGHSLLTYTGLTGLVLETGDKATIAVQGTAQGTDVTVRPGAGINTITVGSPANSLGTIQGPLDIVGQSGTDVLTLNDQGSPPFGFNYVLTPVQLTRFGVAAVAYAKMGSLVLNGSPGLAIYTIQGLPANTQVTLSGAGVGNALRGPNLANTWAITGADVGTLDTRLTFHGIGSLTGGSGGDAFAFRPGGSLSGSLIGSGGVNTLDFSALSTSVVVDLQTGSATGVSGLVSGFQKVIGGTGGPAGTYNLLIGAGGATLKGGLGRRNVLVAGGSAATLEGGNMDDLIIAGLTKYDTEAGLMSWLKIAAYWAGLNNNDSYTMRVANLEAGNNGLPKLDATTVTGNGGGNHLSGHGELALIFTDNKDIIGGFAGSQQVTISP
jgi:hypothetical protein